MPSPLHEDICTPGLVSCQDPELLTHLGPGPLLYKQRNELCNLVSCQDLQLSNTVYEAVNAPVQYNTMKRKRSSTDNTPTAPEAECSPDEEATFKSLGLDTRILQGIAKLGFAHPTAVQAKAVPLALEGRDILARAKTGSGKTAAYLLPVLQSILRRKESGGGGGGGGGGNAVGPSALLLVPTRELAHQVHRVAERLAAYCGKLVRAVNIAQNVSEQVWQ